MTLVALLVALGAAGTLIKIRETGRIEVVGSEVTQ